MARSRASQRCDQHAAPSASNSALASRTSISLVAVEQRPAGVVGKPRPADQNAAAVARDGRSIDRRSGSGAPPAARRADPPATASIATSPTQPGVAAARPPARTTGSTSARTASASPSSRCTSPRPRRPAPGTAASGVLASGRAPRRAGSSTSSRSPRRAPMQAEDDQRLDAAGPPGVRARRAASCDSRIASSQRPSSASRSARGEDAHAGGRCRSCSRV